MNFTLCYDNQVDTATLSGGSWPAPRVLTNLQDYRIPKMARSANLLAASTLVKFAWPANVYIQSLAVAGSNLTVSATYRWRLFSDAAFTIIIYDSGTLSLFPAGSMPNSEIPAGAPNFGTGVPLQVEADRFQRNIIHLLGASSMHARYGQLEIFDATNPAGYVELGRLFAGKVFQPAINPDYGDVSLNVTSRSEVVRAKDGTPYFNQQRSDFCIPFALKELTLNEAMKVLDLQVLSGTVGEVLAVWDYAQVAYWWRRQVFGRLKELDAIQHPMYARYRAAFQVEGVL